MKIHKLSNGVKIRECDDGTIRWYKYGRRHRDYGPAIEKPNGVKEWYNFGYRHREDGPARIHADGSKEWILNNIIHRENGPAVEYTFGAKIWMKHGLIHRTDGPAVFFEEYDVRKSEWWLDDKKLDCNNQEEFEEFLKKEGNKIK